LWPARFAVAFTIPNLFRKLFGEGALSAGVYSLYAQAIKGSGFGVQGSGGEARHFAAATVNLLIVVLSGLTVLSEIFLWIVAHFFDLQPDRLLALKIDRDHAAVCAAGLRDGVFECDFAGPSPLRWSAATPIVLNVALIIGTVLGRGFGYENRGGAEQRRFIFYRCSCWGRGVAQILMLLPSLRAVGFRFEFTKTFWTPPVKKMVTLSLPVAIARAFCRFPCCWIGEFRFVLPVSINKENEIVSGFHFLGKWISYPLEWVRPRA